MVSVYSLPSCVQCNATYRALDSKKIEYEVFDLSTMPEKAKQFKDQGLMQAPIVEANGELWSGFRVDKIAQLAG